MISKCMAVREQTPDYKLLEPTLAAAKLLLLCRTDIWFQTVQTTQFSRSLVPECAQYCNSSLNELSFAGDGVAAFKSQINRALLFD